MQSVSTLYRFQNAPGEKFFVRNVLFWGALLPTAVLAHKHGAQLKYTPSNVFYIKHFVLSRSFFMLQVLICVVLQVFLLLIVEPSVYVILKYC